MMKSKTHGGDRSAQARANGRKVGRPPSSEPLAIISTTIYDADYRRLRAIAKQLNPRRPSLREAIRDLLTRAI